MVLYRVHYDDDDDDDDYYYYYYYYNNCNWVDTRWHPVAVVQYTFTHKQYTDYRERNIHNKKKEKLELRAVPLLCELYPGICLTIEEKARNNLRVVECPDIPVAVVQYTFTHKQHTEQHNKTEYTEQRQKTITVIQHSVDKNSYI
jgi:hypothetical protein